MTTTQLQDIHRALESITSVICEWTGHMPPDSEAYDVSANDSLRTITAQDVLDQLTLHILLADTEAEKIDMAIAAAIESAIGAPDNCGVALMR